jgi:hypothetical protein
MKKSSSWEGNRFVASQEIPRNVWNPKVHYYIHKCPPPAAILSQLDPSISPSPALCLWIRVFHNKIRSYGEELLAPRPKLKLEDHNLSAVRECSFNIIAATFHIGCCSSIRNPRKRHTVVTGTHLSHGQYLLLGVFTFPLKANDIHFREIHFPSIFFLFSETASVLLIFPSFLHHWCVIF